MTDTPPSDGPSQGAEFDRMGLDWKDGIATLPGSDIRVQKISLIFVVVVFRSRVFLACANICL